MAGFQFKQFVIQHEQCAMKVGTDSIMLGSWVDVRHAKTILDIGTGSGLLAIMMAQKVSQSAEIIGIDIDDNAVQQAKDNVSQCKWSELINIKLVALQAFNPSQKFDLIISNPPYFSINRHANQTSATNICKTRIEARQTIALDHLFLLEKVASLLSQAGRFCCVLPADISPQFIEQAKILGLYCHQQLDVKATNEGKIIRSLLEFSLTSSTTLKSCLTIYEPQQTYSKQYRKLCQDYYLNF